MTLDKFVAFDIETDRAAGEAGIMPTCAATMTSRGASKVWHGAAADGARYPRVMPESVAAALVDHLYELDRTGWTVVGLNSLGFDFRVLSKALGDPMMRGKVKALAMGHVDLCFASVCKKGFPVGLSAVAAGLNLKGKMEGMDGLEAIQAWMTGTRKDQDRVLDYVRMDARVTLNVIVGMRRTGVFGWISQKGRYLSWRLPGGVVPDVESCLRMRKPDTSWMTEADRWARATFTRWLEE